MNDELENLKDEIADWSAWAFFAKIEIEELREAVRLLLDSPNREFAESFARDALKRKGLEG